MENKIMIPATRRDWVRCPKCGAKHSLYDNRAECHGVFVKCTRGCGCEFEIVIKEGKQEKKHNEPVSRAIQSERK